MGCPSLHLSWLQASCPIAEIECLHQSHYQFSWMQKSEWDSPHSISPDSTCPNTENTCMCHFFTLPNFLEAKVGMGFRSEYGLKVGTTRLGRRTCHSLLFPHRHSTDQLKKTMGGFIIPKELVLRSFLRTLHRCHSSGTLCPLLQFFSSCPLFLIHGTASQPYDRLLLPESNHSTARSFLLVALGVCFFGGTHAASVCCLFTLSSFTVLSNIQGE